LLGGLVGDPVGNDIVGDGVVGANVVGEGVSSAPHWQMASLLASS